ncbi:FecCD family ABC transporter permease [Alteromonas lipolytica]|uniref:Heme ABC transporter permease n=1 Tax=Alteromonas lipolytica TaxID=1856405 RepID=A0A1E8FF31_9ALTE|nr:iron ABC transporter permease [Alteromonas lipolytica]OFI34376.1 heme ABC transporter permease [Alteromonas lipolytica]GGF81991.1 ABC transporter permease [Alteromonas lipolytica]
MITSAIQKCSVGCLFVLLLVVFCAVLANVWWQADTTAATRWYILTHLQLPLALTAVLVGSALCVSGAALQVVLRNPLADPGIIGIASGASLTAAMVLILMPEWMVDTLHYSLPMACFAGALLSTWIIYRLSARLRGLNTAVILAGIAITTLTSAIMGWLYLFADAQSMRNLTFWVMGSLHQADGWILLWSGPLIVGSCLFILSRAKSLNYLYSGDLVARSAGIDPQQQSKFILLASALAVGCAVAIAGSIAFLGLLVPHYLRLMLGNDNRIVLPASALCGATMLLLVAFVSDLLPYASLPVSMVTATIGGPLLLFALLKGQFK